MEEKIFLLKTEEDTRRFGLQLASHLKPGSVLGLIGGLGAGKTTLTKYIGEALGVRDRILSPSFTIINEYLGEKMPLYHMDLYRLSNPLEILDLGGEEYFYGDGVTVIEWADLIKEILPQDTIYVEIVGEEEEGSRKIRLISQVPLEI